ncbi:hypothetical protein HYDPIDRAFT_84614 [Hydnomerulius pinastri MD-312]|nr:hypothetical protein HYDPIDRAFT_84614 [Hydnomerulius pinastri MD-312]
MSTTRYDQIRNGLRAVWVLAVIWLELGTFHFALHDCHWPDTRQPLIRDSRIVRLLVMADPQIIDRHSYPERGALLSAISQFMVDLNLRKSWNAAFHHLRPDVVVVLGDMMDNGRLSMSADEYEAYFARYQSIFTLEDNPVPTYYLPGNHDIGLGDAASFSLEADTRYTSHFGPRNYRRTIGNHTLVFIDAPALAEEDVVRAEFGHSYDTWPALQNGPAEFVKHIASTEPQGSLVLFTHIPLARPIDSSCGPLREKGSIRQGFGFGYQNTLMDGATEFLLESLKPSLVMSGDDHDYCEYEHTIPSTNERVREVTVKSISMAMGIRRPGFQLVSLTSTVPSPDQLTQIPVSPPLDAPCLLPDQLGIYLHIYIPLVVLSLILLLASNVMRLNASPILQTWDKKRSRRDASEIPHEMAHRNGFSHDADTDEESILPSPAIKHHTRPRGRSFSSPWTWTFMLGGQRRRITLPNPCASGRSRVEHRVAQQEVGLLRGFGEDVLAVAWPPVCVFIVAAWWVMHW